MAFCKNCGNQLSADAAFCGSCGTPVAENTQASVVRENHQQNFVPNTGYAPQDNLISKLSGKIKTEAIVWIVIACLQVIIGIFNIITGIELFDYYEDGTLNLISGFFVLLVAAVNFTTAFRNMKYANEIFTKPVGIVKKYSPVGGVVATLIYNVIFGGIIGVVGSIFGFVTRNFVMSNRQAFTDIENDYIGNVK